MLLFGALGSNAFSRMLRIPITLLMPLVLLMSLVGTFAIRANPVDLIVAVVFGVIGFLLRLNKFPPAPIIIGFVLGQQFEFTFRQGLVFTDGSFLAFFKSPIATVLFCITGLILLNLFGFGKLVRRVLERRRTARGG